MKKYIILSILASLLFPACGDWSGYSPSDVAYIARPDGENWKIIVGD